VTEHHSYAARKRLYLISQLYFASQTRHGTMTLDNDKTGVPRIKRCAPSQTTPYIGGTRISVARVSLNNTGMAAM